MALSAQRRAELATMNIPSEMEIQQRTQAFMLESGFSIADLSGMIGYAATSLGLFLKGNYNINHPRIENTLQIRAALKQYLDLHEVSKGFDLATVHYETQSFRQVRAAALNALRRSTAYIVDGPPGTEKTHSLRRVQAEIDESREGRAFYIYARVNHSPQSFLMECCIAAGIPHRGSIDSLLRKLRFVLSKGRTLFIVDEAQHLDRSGLEVLRQLLDLPPHFGVILAGSHDLTQRLSHWQMEQWRSRVRKTLYLNGPSREDAHRILRSELGPQLTDADCDETIAECQSTAQRIAMVRGKATAQTFQYTSARSLFNAIEQTHEALTAAQSGQQKESAA